MGPSRFVLQACALASSLVGVRVSSSGNTPGDRPLSQMSLRLSQSCLTVFSACSGSKTSATAYWRKPGNEGISHSAAQSLGRSSSFMAVSVLTRESIDGHIRPHVCSLRGQLHRVENLGASKHCGFCCRGPSDLDVSSVARLSQLLSSLSFPFTFLIVLYLGSDQPHMWGPTALTSAVFFFFTIIVTTVARP